MILAIKCFNPRPPKRTLCPKRGFGLCRVADVSIHVLRRGRCVGIKATNRLYASVFQSTSSEEDVVSIYRAGHLLRFFCFNPRPPKRTLCLYIAQVIYCGSFVSIHVLRRGRCVKPCYRRFS